MSKVRFMSCRRRALALTLSSLSSAFWRPGIQHLKTTDVSLGIPTRRTTPIPTREMIATATGGRRPTTSNPSSTNQIRSIGARCRRLGWSTIRNSAALPRPCAQPPLGLIAVRCGFGSTMNLREAVGWVAATDAGGESRRLSRIFRANAKQYPRHGPSALQLIGGCGGPRVRGGCTNLTVAAVARLLYCAQRLAAREGPSRARLSGLDPAGAD